MNIQTRKLNLIENLILLQDVKLIDKIEVFFKSFQRKRKATNLIPMSLEEFYARNRQSQIEISEGKLITHEDVKKHFARKSK